MATEKDNENTRINPKHYVGKALQSATVGGSLILGAILVAPLTGTMIVWDALTETPDQTGTEQQAEVYESLSEQFRTALEKKSLLKFAQSNQKLSDFFDVPNHSERYLGTLNDIEATSTKKSERALVALYTQGITDNEAAISEEQFADAIQYLSRNVLDPETLGYETEIHPGMLDECIAETPVSSSASMMEKYQASKNINACMNEEYNEDTILSMIAMIALMGLGAGGVLGTAHRTRNWKDEPKRLPKRSAPSHGRH